MDSYSPSFSSGENQSSIPFRETAIRKRRALFRPFSGFDRLS